MVAVQIRGVPDDVRGALAREASARGESLQTYLLEVLAREARSAENREFLRQHRPTPLRGVGPVDIVSVIDEGRRVQDAKSLGETE